MKSIHLPLFVLILVFVSGQMFAEEINYSDVPNNVIGLVVHGYPSSAYESPGKFLRISTGYDGLPYSLFDDCFRIPKERQNYIFGYRLSASKSHNGNVYIRELGDFNNGSRRLTYDNPQCWISLGKCEWLYRKAFFEDYKDFYATNFANDIETLIFMLTANDIRFVDLFVSKEYVKSKLDDIAFSVDFYIDTNGNGTIDADEKTAGNLSTKYLFPDRDVLAQHLYDTAQKYKASVPQSLWFLTHSMGGMFTLRYLTSEVNEYLYNFYRDYSRDDFELDILEKDAALNVTGGGTLWPMYQEMIDAIIVDSVNFPGIASLPDQASKIAAAKDFLYPIFKLERENNVPKALIQDGPLSGSQVAEYAFRNFDALYGILNDPGLFYLWRTYMQAGLLVNIALSCLEIWLGSQIVGIPFIGALGEELITIGIINIAVDAIAFVYLFGVNLVKTGTVNGTDRYGVSLWGGPPTSMFPGVIEGQKAGPIDAFNVNEVELMKDLRIHSDLIKKYENKVPKYRTESGEEDNIEIHNVTVKGVESIRGGGYDIWWFPTLIALGIPQTSILLNFMKYLLEYTDPATSTLTLGVFHWVTNDLLGYNNALGYAGGATVANVFLDPSALFKHSISGNGMFLKVIGIIVGAVYGFISYVVTDAVSMNNACEIEMLIGLMYDFLGISHEPGAGLFCHSDSTGLIAGREVAAFKNNERGYVYSIDITTKNQGNSQQKIGNTNPDRDQWENEVNMEYYGPAKDRYDLYEPYITSHGWSINSIFRPLSALTEEVTLMTDPETNIETERIENYIFFNNHIYPDRSGASPYHFDNSFGDVSQVTRNMRILKNNEDLNEVRLPELEYLGTDALRSRPDRDLFTQLIFGLRDGYTPNSIVASEGVKYNNDATIFQTASRRIDRGIDSIRYTGTAGTKVASLDYITFANTVTIMPLDVFNYYDGLKFLYSINGESLRSPQHIASFAGGFETVSDYADAVMQGSSSLPLSPTFVYDDHGKGILFSPKFKEGYNSIVFEFEDPAGKLFYKDIQVIQNTIPPFIKPVFPLMNQYVNSGSFDLCFEGLHITDPGDGSITMPGDWFGAATFEVKVDGQIVATTKDGAPNFKVYAQLSGLTDGNHIVEILAVAGGVSLRTGWRFWVDTHAPQINFPDTIIFSNQKEENAGGVTVYVKDTVPFTFENISRDVDTVQLSNLSVSVAYASGTTIAPLIDRNDVRLGAHSAKWNGWVNGQPLDHGSYLLTVEAADRVNNFGRADKELIIDNRGPVFRSIALNTNLVNTSSDLLELNYNLALDTWEKRARVDLEFLNSDSGEKFSLASFAFPDVDSRYTVSYFFEGRNVFKDGVYDVTVTAVDELGNSSNPVVFEGVVVDRTKAHVREAVVTPFLLGDGQSSLTLSISLDEESDVPANRSANLNATVGLLDPCGTTVVSLLANASLIADSVLRDVPITVPAEIGDGKYFLDINVTDKNGNVSRELVPFVKNAITPEITAPAALERIDGIVAIRGNVVDPRFTNSLPFERYEMYYAAGEIALPSNLDDLSGWGRMAMSTPEYQRTVDMQSNTGRFPVEGGNVLGLLDTSSFEGYITVLVVVQEQGGYRIGLVRTFYVLHDAAVDTSVDINIDPASAGPVSFGFSGDGDEIVVSYTVNHALDNPVDIGAFVRQNGTDRIVKQWSFFNLKSNSIKGVPTIGLQDKGLFVYQNPLDDKFYIVCKSGPDAAATFMINIESSYGLTSFVDGNGQPISDPATLFNSGKVLSLTNAVAAGQTYGIGFSVNQLDELVITALTDQSTPRFYLGEAAVIRDTARLVLYPGTDYPPVRWDGKNDFSQYCNNGDYTIGIEAYGKFGGYDIERVGAVITTPFTLTWKPEEISNRTFHPGVPMLEKSACTVKLYANKACSLSASVRVAGNGAYIIALPTVPASLDSNGSLLVSWAGIDGDGQLVPQANYEIVVVASPLDGSPAVTAIVDNIVVDTSILVDPSITARFDAFDSSVMLDGKHVIAGDASYSIEATPKGKYLPDQNVSIDIEAEKGTKTVTAQPDLNYMVGFRTNYRYLYAKANVKTVVIMLTYRRSVAIFWEDFRYRDYAINLSDTTGVSGPVIDYYYNSATKQFTFRKMPLSQNSHYVSGTLTGHAGSVSETRHVVIIPWLWEYDETLTWGLSAASVSNTYTVDYEFGKDYMDGGSYSCSTGSSSNSDVRVPYPPFPIVTVPADSISFYIYTNLTCNPKATFTEQDYLARADGFAVMGPDIKAQNDYSKESAFVYKDGPVSQTFITDPLASTGMRPENKTSQMWREGRRFFFYYVGEKYPDMSDADKVGKDFNTFGSVNAGGGTSHTASPDLTGGSVKRFGPFDDTFTEQLFAASADCDVRFRLSRVAGTSIFVVDAGTEIVDRILYPFPATVTREVFASPAGHEIGMGEESPIPVAVINGTRHNAFNATKPNFHVTASDVYFNDVVMPKAAYTETISFLIDESTGTGGYRGEFDLGTLYLDAQPSYEDVNITDWMVTNVEASDLDLPGLLGYPVTAKRLFDEHDSVISVPGDVPAYLSQSFDSSWTLAADVNVDGPLLKSERKNLEDSDIDQSGVTAPLFFSDLYPRLGAEDAPRNMYKVDGTGTLSDNGDIVIHEQLEGEYDVKVKALDGDDFGGLAVLEIGYAGKGAKLADHVVLGKTVDTPKKLVAIHGAYTGVAGISYLHKDGRWIEIPVYNADPVRGIVTYWDVSGLNGVYTLRLAAQSGSGFNVSFVQVYVGELVNTIDNDPNVNEAAELTTPDGEAMLILPEGSVIEDTVITIDTIDPEDIIDIAVMPDIAPLGKIIDVQPDGLSFDGVATASLPQVHFTYLREELETVNPLELVIYQLKGDGTLEPIPTIKQAFDVDGVPIWKSDIDPESEFPFPEYAYVKAWGVLSHFSYYVVLEGKRLAEGLATPSVPVKELSTNGNFVSLAGTANPNEALVVYVTDSPVFDPTAVMPLSMNVYADGSGEFTVPYLPVPTEGYNFVFVGYANIADTGYAKCVVYRDSVAPAIALGPFDPIISPNGDGIKDATRIKLTPNEDVTLTISLFTSGGSFPQLEVVSTGKADRAKSVAIDGLDPNGLRLADGDYDLVIKAVDNAGNESIVSGNVIVIDTDSPGATVTTNAAALSPANGDGILDSVEFVVRIDDDAVVSAWVGNSANPEKKKLIGNRTVSAGETLNLEWNGRDYTGGLVMDGEYVLKVAASDKAGNVFDTVFENVPVRIDNTPPQVTLELNANGIYLIPAVHTFTYHLDENAEVTVSIEDPASTVRYGIVQNSSAGPCQFEWNASDTLQEGNYTISLVCKDSLGNVSPVKRSVITLSHDIYPPEIIVTDITVEAEDVLTVVGLQTPVAYDDSEPVTFENNAPAAFPFGETIVTWIARDRYGNQSQADQTVRIKDTTAPVLMIPANILREAESREMNIDIGEANAADIFEVTIINDKPELFGLGTTPVTWLATDEHGNATAMTQLVIIQDTTDPVLTLPADLTVTANGLLSTVNIGEATATDIFDVVVSNDAPDLYPLGLTIVTWTATDSSGNTVSGIQNVTVVDEIAPVIGISGIVDGMDYTEHATPVVVIVDHESGIAHSSVTLDGEPFASGTVVTELGTHTLAATGTDHAGNTTTVIRTFSIYATTTLTISATPCEYSDTTTMTATLIARSVPVGGKTLSFSLDGADWGTAVTDENGTAVFTRIVEHPAGQYGVMVSFAQDNADFLRPGEQAGTLDVSAEKSEIAYVGELIVQYPNSITLAAQLAQEDDGSAGHFENGRVKFDVFQVTGDGTSVPVGSYTVGATSTGRASIVRTFGTGVYSVLASIVPDGYFATGNDYVIVPIYNPEGAFITGGGWISVPNPQGGNPGKVHFGFNCKYKHGEPDGNLELSYKDGDINLKSTDMEWLVINTTDAQFQGTGTIKDRPGVYTFKISCFENATGADVVTIRIWEGTNVYAVPLFEQVNRPLGGGSIKIHK